MSRSATRGAEAAWASINGNDLSTTSMASGYGKTLGQHAVETPCVKVCEIDDASGLCTGCGRSLAEIAAWSTMTAGERRRIIGVLHERRAGACKKVDAG